MHPKIQCIRKFELTENTSETNRIADTIQRIRNQSKIRKGPRNLTQTENSIEKKGQVIRKLDFRFSIFWQKIDKTNIKIKQTENSV